MASLVNPLQLNSDRPYEAEPIDVWGVGVILYTMLAGSTLALMLFDSPSIILLDTPWDEPTQHSPEFYRYLSGEIYQEEPWNRFSSEALCSCFAIRTR